MKYAWALESNGFEFRPQPSLAGPSRASHLYDCFSLDMEIIAPSSGAYCEDDIT